MTGIIKAAITIVFFVGVYKVVYAYFKDIAIKVPIKNYIIILLFLGAAPSLTDAAPKIGEDLVKPVIAIVHSVSSNIASDMQKSVK